MWTPPPSHSSSRMAAHAIHPPSQHSYPQQTSPPTSLSSHLHIPTPCRQLHPPKSPLYRPAVLRAIEGPLRPPTAASTPTGSPKSLSEEFSEDKSCAFSNDDIASEIGVIGDIYEEDGAIDVAGPPMRNHWKPDAQATACDSPTCIRNFTIMVRRHHCRRCGNVFCFQHATKWLPLSQNARFHPKGLLSKVCDGCYSDYQRLLQMKRNNSMSSTSTSSTLSNASPMMTMGAKPIAGTRSAEAGLAGKVGSYLGSVPRDWSWSTF